MYEFWFDWRRSLVDSAESLHRRILRVLQDSGAAKVSLLAHSQGGLVARACITDQPVAQQPGRGDYVLDVIMPARGGGYRFTVQAQLPGGGPVLRQQGLLVATQS